MSVLFRVSYPALASCHATPRHATPGRLPQINALQLYKLHTTATCYLLVEICFVVQFGTGWQVAICKLYILCLCEWHHVYGVTPSLWAQTWCHGVTAGLFNHIKRTWNTCLRVSVSLLHRFLSGSTSLPLISPHFRSGLFPSLLSSLHPSFCPEGRERFKLWTKDTRRKTLQKTFEVCSPLRCSEKCHPHPRNAFKRSRK